MKKCIHENMVLIRINSFDKHDTCSSVYLCTDFVHELRTFSVIPFPINPPLPFNAFIKICSQICPHSSPISVCSSNYFVFQG